MVRGRGGRGREAGGRKRKGQRERESKGGDGGREKEEGESGTEREREKGCGERERRERQPKAHRLHRKAENLLVMSGRCLQRWFGFVSFDLFAYKFHVQFMKTGAGPVYVWRLCKTCIFCFSTIVLGNWVL